MKRFIFLLLVMCSVNAAFCQSAETSIDSVSVPLEEKPQFVGGIKAFYKYIGENYRLPNVKLKGKVLMEFIVEKDGSLTNIRVIEDLGYGTGKEAIRVLKKCPRWIPGKQKGVPVRVVYSLPIAISS